jgi:hypothetical protein
VTPFSSRELARKTQLPSLTGASAKGSRYIGSEHPSLGGFASRNVPSRAGLMFLIQTHLSFF